MLHQTRLACLSSFGQRSVVDPLKFRTVIGNPNQLVAERLIQFGHLESALRDDQHHPPSSHLDLKWLFLFAQWNVGF